MNIKNIVSDSYDKELEYSHDCWGRTEVDEIYTLNYDKLRENILIEIMKILNNQLYDNIVSENTSIHERMIARNTILNTKKIFKKELL